MTGPVLAELGVTHQTDHAARFVFPHGLPERNQRMALYRAIEVHREVRERDDNECQWHPDRATAKTKPGEHTRADGQVLVVVDRALEVITSAVLSVACLGCVRSGAVR